MHTSPARRRLAIGLPAALIATLAITAFVPVASATTSVTTAEQTVIGWINSARSTRGLLPLRYDGNLGSISGVRASRMASSNVLSHTVGGSLSAQLRAYRVPWYRYGEDIGWSTATWPTTSARAIFNAWMGSPPHRAMILSSRFNYVGVGLAYRSSNRRTYASAVFAETTDHTGAISRVTSATRTGDDVRWTWTGYDVRLQTRTAGLRDFDVQYRVDYGSWHLLRDNTKAYSITLADRTHGRSYAVRVRATDQRGNVGAWSSEKRIGVP
jgi:uncharacterized protein YkwD